MAANLFITGLPFAMMFIDSYDEERRRNDQAPRCPTPEIAICFLPRRVAFHATPETALLGPADPSQEGRGNKVSQSFLRGEGYPKVDDEV